MMLKFKLLQKIGINQNVSHRSTPLKCIIVFILKTTEPKSVPSFSYDATARQIKIITYIFIDVRDK